MDGTALDRLRTWMAREGVELWLETGEDPHGSEYPPDRWQTRRVLSGFTGSAGLVGVTPRGGALATDSRYWLQAPRELAQGFDLVRSDFYPDRALQKWALKLGSLTAVAADPDTMGWARWRAWESFCKEKGTRLVPAPGLWDFFWEGRPELPSGLIRDYESAWPTEGRLHKLNRLRASMRQEGASHLLVSALDETAWVLNLRGSDISCNPLFLSWLIVSQDKAVLYARLESLEPGLQATLIRDGVEVRPYEDVADGLPSDLGGWLLSPTKTPASFLLDRAGWDKLILAPHTPVAILKAVKSPAELQGFREAMRRDGRAMVRFLRWWEESEGTLLTEGIVATRLWDYRLAGGAWIPCFETIAAWNGNGAVVHYNPGETGEAIDGDGVLLLDSGAHYAMGTTDVTRVLCRGKPTEEWITDYTLVLRAYLAVARARFPTGTMGYQIDALARGVLWVEGLQYGHGTGHGVGHVLTVHEGPQKLSPEALPQALQPGMVVSHEPGLYREGRWGMRLENLAVVVADIENEFGTWQTWETLTLAPFEPRLVNPSLLTSGEKAWLVEYHRRLCRELGHALEPADAEWLADCQKRWESVLRVGTDPDIATR